MATALGVNRNTIGLWEQGMHLPRDREVVLRLAEELTLSPAETDQLLRAAEFPDVYGTPDWQRLYHQLRPPIVDFVGRARETQQLLTALRAAVFAKNGSVITGIQGMGGIGKTELASVVAHHLRDTFPDMQIVLNLRGTSADPLPPAQALQNIIHSLSLDARLPADLDALQARYRALLDGRRALILADDARDATQVRPLIPPLGCALLVTSRTRFTLPGMTTIHLEQFTEGEAVTFLCGICRRLSPKEAAALAQACGYLPLALRVSGSNLYNDPALQITDYLKRLGDARLRLTQLRDPDDSQLDVAASLTLSYKQLDRHSRASARPLRTRSPGL